VQRLSRIVSEQHSAVMDEVQFQRYMIHQVPGGLHCCSYADWADYGP
jgi:hypothetical protein